MFCRKTFTSTVLQYARITSNTCYLRFVTLQIVFRTVLYRFASRRLLRPYRLPCFKHVPFFILFRFKSFTHSSTSFRFASKRLLRLFSNTLAYLQTRVIFVSFRFNFVPASFQLRFVPFHFNSRRISPQIAHFYFPKFLRDLLQLLSPDLHLRATHHGAHSFHW